jgi:hypothetical protein
MGDSPAAAQSAEDDEDWETASSDDSLPAPLPAPVTPVDDSRPAPVPPVPPYSILFAGANKKLDQKLALENEVRQIQNAFIQHYGSWSWGDNVIFKHSFFASGADLSRSMRDCDPVCLHLSCHGNPNALVLYGQELAAKPFVDFIKSWCASGARLQLIVLNACCSAEIANALSKYVDFAIGHSNDVDDADAVKFSRELYGHLGSGKSLELSFKAAKMASTNYHLYGRKDASKFRLCPPNVPGTAPAVGNVPLPPAWNMRVSREAVSPAEAAAREPADRGGGWGAPIQRLTGGASAFCNLLTGGVIRGLGQAAEELLVSTFPSPVDPSATAPFATLRVPSTLPQTAEKNVVCVLRLPGDYADENELQKVNDEVGAVRSSLLIHITQSPEVQGIIQGTPSGLKWVEIGERPTSGEILDNQQLKIALSRKRADYIASQPSQACSSARAPGAAVAPAARRAPRSASPVALTCAALKQPL